MYQRDTTEEDGASDEEEGGEETEAPAAAGPPPKKKKQHEIEMLLQSRVMKRRKVPEVPNKRWRITFATCPK